jgi:hypothetical protein
LLDLEQGESSSVLAGSIESGVLMDEQVITTQGLTKRYGTS